MDTSIHTSEAMVRRRAKRRAAERRFRAYGATAVAIAIAALGVLFASIIGNGYTAFQQTYIALEVTYDQETLGIGEARDAAALSAANYPGLVKKAMRETFPEVIGRRAKRRLYGIVSTGARLHPPRARARRSRARRGKPGAYGCRPTTTSTCSSRAISTATPRKPSAA